MPLSRRRLTAALISFAAITGAALAVPSSAVAVNRAYTVDCASDVGHSGAGGGAATDSFTVTLTNCNYMTVNSGSVTMGSSSPVTAPATGTALTSNTITFGTGTDVRVSDTLAGLSASGTRVRMRTYLAGGEDIPSGVKIVTNDFVLPATTADQVDLAATGVDGNGPIHLLGGVPACELAATDTPALTPHAYSTMDITVSTAGDYTFRGISSSPAGAYAGLAAGYDPMQDPFLVLYSTFDPANPDTGVLGCNDDLSGVSLLTPAPSGRFQLRADGSVIEVHQPYFTATSLAAGEYTLVLMTYDALSTSDLHAGSSAVGGPFPIVDRSTTFELWGPAGGLSVGHATAALPATPQLPAGATDLAGDRQLAATGPDLSTLWIAMAAVISGLFLWLRRPRNAASR